MGGMEASLKIRYGGILETFHFFRLRRIIGAAYFYITIAMEGKPRLPDLTAFSPGTNIHIGAGGIPVVFHHKPSHQIYAAFPCRIFRQIRVEHFSIPDNKAGSFLFLKTDTRHTGHFLAQIIDNSMCVHKGTAAGFPAVHHIYRGIITAQKQGLCLINPRPGPAKSRRHGPVFIDGNRFISHRLFPARFRKIRFGIIFIQPQPSSVCLFPQEKSGIPVRPFPVIAPVPRIGNPHLSAAVIIGNYDFGKKSFLISPEIIILHGKGLGIRPPAGRQGHSHTIVSFPYFVTDVIGLVVQPPVILGISRRKQTVRYILSVHAAFVNSPGSDIQPGLYWFSVLPCADERTEHGDG